MSTLKVVGATALVFSTGVFGASLAMRAPAAKDRAEPYVRLGEPVTEAALSRLNIDVDPNGTGLPPGSGSSVHGKEVYEEQCESCHGPAGKGGVGAIPALTGGVGSLASAKPVKTLNSFWPYAPSAFDYIRRTMPITQPQSLSASDTYSVLAYLLSVDGIVTPSKVLNAQNLPKVAMPNRNGFVTGWPTRSSVPSASLDKTVKANR